MEIPVYLFTGFLEAGKTTFIQKTLEDERFNQGENTLLLICEEGIEDYEPAAFSGARVFLERAENPEDLTEEKLERLCKKHACERVIVEYNGMWMLDSLYSALPEEWMVYQEFLFADAKTFLTYNANMRERMVDKLKSCEMVVFTRADETADQLAFHQIVRGVNRRCEIAYEDAAGNVTYDDIPDELPFDINAPVIEVALEDYASWYRDISEEMDKYEGKTVQLSGSVVIQDKLPDNSFIFGRPVMTCCADDVAFAGVLCVAKSRGGLQNQDWITLTAKISLQDSKVYGRRGPVFSVISVEKGTAPENDVATFY